jgi:hypothetical protein
VTPVGFDGYWYFREEALQIKSPLDAGNKKAAQRAALTFLWAQPAPPMLTLSKSYLDVNVPSSELLIEG